MDQTIETNGHDMAGAVPEFVTIDRESFAVLLAASAFARDVLHWSWADDAGEAAGDIQEMGVAFGLVSQRTPTAEELADPTWWGHQFEIKADDVSVMEFSAPFHGVVAQLAKMEASAVVEEAAE